MRIKKFNESSGKSEKEILNHIRSIFIEIGDENDVELSFGRSNITQGLMATININIHLNSEHLITDINTIKNMSAMTEDLQSVSKVLEDVKNLLTQYENESEVVYRWTLVMDDLNVYSRMTLEILTEDTFPKYDPSLHDWEIEDEDYEVEEEEDDDDEEFEEDEAEN
jgi:hypothetical protein